MRKLETIPRAFIVSFVCDVLPDLVPFVQFKKCEKHPWRSATLLRVTLLHGYFSRFLNCTNGSKSYKTSHIAKEKEKTTGSSSFIKEIFLSNRITLREPGDKKSARIFLR